MPLRCLWLAKGLGRGGVERLLVDMLPLVDSDAFEVDVAYQLPWKDDHHRELEELGNSVTCLGQRGTSQLRLATALRQHLVHNRYDIVHSHSPIPGSMARLVRPRHGGPAIIHTEHNMWDRYRWPTRLLNSATYHLNQSVIAVSDSVANTIKPVLSWRAPEVQTVHHGTVLTSIRRYRDDERADRRRSIGLPPTGFVIGQVANFTPKKDHRNLLQALTGPGLIEQATVALIGLGPLESELRREARDLGLESRVFFLGSRDDVFELLPIFDSFCLSSRYEGLPISLVEAMATGLPCVATAVGGIPEVLEDGVNGYLAPPGDPLALRTAIERVMSDPDEAARLGVRARQRAESLDLGNAVVQLEELYHQALDPARRVRDRA